MSDLTAASLFENIFKKLAADPTEQHVRWARDLWAYTSDFDFSPYQIGADEALVVLGLARRGVDPEYPGGGEVWLYGPSGCE